MAARRDMLSCSERRDNWRRWTEEGKLNWLRKEKAHARAPDEHPFGPLSILSTFLISKLDHPVADRLSCISLRSLSACWRWLATPSRLLPLHRAPSSSAQTTTTSRHSPPFGWSSQSSRLRQRRR